MSVDKQKSQHGVITRATPLSITSGRRAFSATLEDVRGAVEEGAVVRFVPSGKAAKSVSVLVEKARKKPPSFPCRLNGIVVEVNRDGLVIRELPSLRRYTRDTPETAVGEPVHVGDLVRFDAMADDGRAWELMTKGSTRMPADLRDELPGVAEEMDAELAAFEAVDEGDAPRKRR